VSAVNKNQKNGELAMNLLNSFNFELPTKIEYGVGAAGGLAEVIANLKARNVLLITDKGVMRSGLLERVAGPLEAHNLKWKVFDRVEPNPKDYNVQEGTEIAIWPGLPGGARWRQSDRLCQSDSGGGASGRCSPRL
jgi:hypothetical protein